MKNPKAKTIPTKKINPKKTLKKAPGDSQYATSASILIDAHYERIGVRKKWNKARVDRLCGFLRMNYGEIASMLCMPHSEFTRIIVKPKPFPGPLCILLSVIEHRYLKEYTKDTIDNLFKFT